MSPSIISFAWGAFVPGTLQAPGIHKVLFQEWNGLQSADASEDSFIRSVAIRFYAHEVYQAAVLKGRMDEARLKDIFRQMAQKNVLTEFNKEIAQFAAQDGKLYRNAGELIDAEFMQNPFKRFFKSASRKELLDYVEYGKNCFRASPWEYRKLGMWNAVADFVAVCKHYPVMSGGVIAAVAYLGHKYPFLGGVSGIAIIVWGVAASMIHEIRAAMLPKRTEQQADHYVCSGENLAAALITSLGYKGIKNGTINGFEYARENAALLPNASVGKKAVSGFLTAVKATSKEQHKTNPLESFLFVSGLFDNVLLPFNWAADKLKISR